MNRERDVAEKTSAEYKSRRPASIDLTQTRSGFLAIILLIRMPWHGSLLITSCFRSIHI